MQTFFQPEYSFSIFAKSNVFSFLISCYQTIIARRSDMLVMSSEGPLGAYVNPGGFVHEIMTLHNASGLALVGRATTEYSWFPG